MTETNQKQLGNTLWSIADQLRGAMDADDFRDYMLSFLFLRYLSDNYETAAKKELGRDYPDVGGDARKVPLALWYANNVDDIPEFEKQMRRKVHYVIQPAHLWNSIANLARTQNAELLNTLQAGFKYIETESFESTFQGLFSEIDLSSPKLGKKYEDRNAKLCTIIQKIAEGLAEFSTDIDALGDAYEYLIGQFAAGSGKKAGEFYTPQQISDILSAIVTLDSQEPKTGTKKRLESVMDFACGSGSLLLNVRKKVNQGGGTIGKTVDDAMVAIERDNPRLKGVLPKDYARPGLDKHRLGELIDLIATISLTAASEGEKTHRSGAKAEVRMQKEEENYEGRKRPQRPHQTVCAANHPPVRKSAEIHGSSSAGQTVAPLGNIRRGELPRSPSRTEQSRVHREMRRLAAGTGGIRVLARVACRWGNRASGQAATASCRVRRTHRHLRHDHQESARGRKSEGRMRKEDGLPLLHSSFLLPTFPVLANGSMSSNQSGDCPAQNAMKTPKAKPQSLRRQHDTLGYQSRTLATLRDTLLPQLLSGSLQINNQIDQRHD